MIALCIIATGKYTRFLPEVLESAGRFFCAGHERCFFVFTDSEFRHSSFELRHFPASPEPWPGPTLHRYRTLLRAEKSLRDCQFVYYVDADSRFVRPVGDEIFGDLVATVHYGFCDSPAKDFTYEYRRTSRAYVPPQQRGRARHYYCGGFQGGAAATYLAATRVIDAAIADDERRGIVAWWHDESHWNRYLIDHPPTVELSHEYMCPEPWRPETQRIVIVGKDNRELRS